MGERAAKIKRCTLKRIYFSFCGVCGVGGVGGVVVLLRLSSRCTSEGSGAKIVMSESFPVSKYSKYDVLKSNSGIVVVESFCCCWVREVWVGGCVGGLRFVSTIRCFLLPSEGVAICDGVVKVVLGPDEANCAGKMGDEELLIKSTIER